MEKFIVTPKEDKDNCLKILYLQYFVDLFYLAKSKT